MMRERSAWPDLGIGLGLRSPHYARVLSGPTQVQWFEAVSENYFSLPGAAGNRPLRTLERVRANHPVVLHGVSLSIGSTDPLDFAYLHQLKALADHIEPAWLSDHICWTGMDGLNVHDLLPLPYTRETIRHVADRISRVQDFLGRRMLFENVSSYLTYRHSEMTEWEFISEICRRADCGLLLDLNNIYVSSVNHDFDPMKFLQGVPAERVGQYHLAGHRRQGELLIDTHDEPVPDSVWSLYREALVRIGPRATMIERDANIPAYDDLEAEALRAGDLRNEVRLSTPVHAKEGAHASPHLTA